jgi:mRNA interferase MazF
MRRGEVWTADLTPVVGTEADKAERPVVIISNDTRNLTSVRTLRGVITAVPLTSNVARVFAF